MLAPAHDTSRMVRNTEHAIAAHTSAACYVRYMGARIARMRHNSIFFMVPLKVWFA